MFKKISGVCLASLFLFGLFGCNTMAGAGKDMERGGEKIQQKAND
jgi:predicted small secreted protein